jgi:sialate O-acetylesterase
MDRPDQYQSLFPALVSNWRSLWAQGEFPFYYVQIAPYNYGAPYKNDGKSSNSAFLREAQLKALDKIPSSGMAVIMDVAEEFCIHPAHKKEGAERLALLALAKTYGVEGLAYESPTPDSLIFNGNTVTIRFKNSKTGLTSYGKPLTTFQVAGKDKKFWNATATISAGRIVLSSPRVPEPVAVRYAFKDFVVGELFSTDGLPISSFRTDDWTDGVFEQ